MEKENHKQEKTDYFLPLSIIIAAVLISGAWIYTVGLEKVNKNNSDGGSNAEIYEQAAGAAGPEKIKPVGSEDHIRGNLDAPVKIVEFSDMECPFCKIIHASLKEILKEYEGKAAWVYRHYPIEQLHPVKARKAAEAAECANELGGNEKFWAYLDRYFEVTPSNNKIDLFQLPQIAESVGLNRVQFESCLNSGKYVRRVENDLKDGESSGVQGTPYMIVIASGGEKYAVSGAREEMLRAAIEEALKK